MSKMTFCQKIGGIDEVLEKFYPALMLVYIIYIISNSTPQKKSHGWYFGKPSSLNIDPEFQQTGTDDDICRGFIISHQLYRVGPAILYLLLRHSRGFSPLPSCVGQAYVQLSQLALERRANADLEGEALAMSWDLFNANDENDHLNATLLKNSKQSF